ncbi:MAG TPA: phosphate acyltransferase PlsX [Parachlamydiaceae bacterium]|nr:phosphate acyltransferase PlsX [Parachlamydiaceae bacterium]
MRIAIDLMGSDSSPEILFEGLISAVTTHKHSCTFILLATSHVEHVIKKKYALFFENIPESMRIFFQIVTEEILMDDDPLSAVRHRRQSSLVQGIRLVKKKQADAFVSTGNTGALLACASLSLPALPGIKRPALLASLPTKKGSVVVIDVGGNVSCKAAQLVQFALLGAAYQRSLGKKKQPKVGLLNIGIESRKGTSEVRQAYQQLKEMGEASLKPISFVGNVEARELFEGKVDVLVTDGFSGNVLLKTIEGFSVLVVNALKNSLREIDSPQLGRFMKTFDYKEYPGAILCGIEGVVVKCHGNSSSLEFAYGIKEAIRLVHRQFIDQIKQSLASFEAD